MRRRRSLDDQGRLADIAHSALLGVALAILLDFDLTIGVLLIVALLVIPAATARRFASSPERMAVGAAVAGIVAVAGGLFASANLDSPSGPSIVVVALLLFVVSRIRFSRSAGNGR
ncbi:metal ABC transporter permease [Candidatus Rariloculus sp.]|uniref:metal ABC transporter permease n=1 Tax=Candidatus Rariloculus sp. TaxID=3101265 RepID=UPI003D109A36